MKTSPINPKIGSSYPTEARRYFKDHLRSELGWIIYLSQFDSLYNFLSFQTS